MKVYQFGLRPPVENEAIVRAQLRAAHDYQNDLVAIERGRRSALRAIYDASDEVNAAIELVRAATRSTRKQAVSVLGAARKAALAEAKDECDQIQALDASICRAARALTSCHWGSYIDIESAARQSRKQHLYGKDALTPNDPAFRRGPRWRDALGTADPRAAWWLAHGHVGMQIQNGLTTSEVLACEDRRVRLELGSPNHKGRRYGTLWLRVGSDKRDPIWAKFPIKTHRDVPQLAKWKWVRVSVHPEGTNEHWSVEITVDLEHVDMPPRGGSGSIAVEWEWSDVGGAIRVARYRDASGIHEIILPAELAAGIAKPNGIRSVRDIILNDLKEKLPALIRADGCAPDFVKRAATTMHLWKSPQRFRALFMQWQRETSPSGKAFEILVAWEKREWHLYNYEGGARGQALRARREIYRLLAARWRTHYQTVLLSDQDLSFAAKRGDEGDIRFIAGVSELRTCLRHAFGNDAIDARWRDDVEEGSEQAERLWCERTYDAWTTGGARGDGRFAALKTKTRNAWAARKARRAEKGEQNGIARIADGKGA
jgi:hypothetical protein